MAAKRSAGPVRPAFRSGGVVRTGHQGSVHQDGLEPDDRNDAALLADLERSAAACGYCAGHWPRGGVFVHDPACIFAGRAAERALIAARRRNGLV